MTTEQEARAAQVAAEIRADLDAELAKQPGSTIFGKAIAYKRSTTEEFMIDAFARAIVRETPEPEQRRPPAPFETDEYRRNTMTDYEREGERKSGA